MKDNLYRDSIALFVSKGVSVCLALTTAFLIARKLGVTEFGKFAAVLAFGQILTIFVDPGMGQLAAKSIAAGSSERFSKVNQIFTWRIYLTVTMSFLIPVLAYALFSSPDVRIFAIWITPAIIVVSMMDFFDWIFKGVRKVVWGIAVQIIIRASLLALRWFALLRTDQLIALTLAYWVAGILCVILGLTLLAKKVQPVRLVKLSMEFFEGTMPEVYKLGAIIIIAIAAIRIDILLVNKFCGDTSAGYYAAGGRIIDGLREIVPTAIFSTHLPVFAASSSQILVLQRKFRPAMIFLVVTSLLIAVGGSIYAEPLFVQLFGDSYREGAIYFGPLIWSNVFMFPNVLMFAILYARNDHRTPTIGIALTFLISVGLNVLLLPYFGVIAACWTRVIAEGANFGFQAQALIRKRIIIVHDLITRPALLVGSCLCTFFLMKGLAYPLIPIGILTTLGMVGVLVHSNLISKIGETAPSC